MYWTPRTPPKTLHAQAVVCFSFTRGEALRSQALGLV
jgi:hypothetical protein